MQKETNEQILRRELTILRRRQRILSVKLNGDLSPEKRARFNTELQGINARILAKQDMACVFKSKKHSRRKPVQCVKIKE